MSRYRPDPRYSAGDLAYRDPPPQRWDTDRFARERDYRGPPAFEQRPAYDDAYGSPRGTRVVERERVYEDDRQTGPRGSREERRFFEEDYYRDDPRAARGALVPVRTAEPPPRPGMLRRQSSWDYHDRRPSRRPDDYPPPREPVRRYEPEFDDVQIQEPGRFGDDGFREYKEREWITRRRRNSSGSRSRSRSRDRGEFREEIREEVREEKPYPRRGKTRMPKRLVSTRVLYDLGYPYYEEDEKTILIEKALGPENIDQVFSLSKEYFARETTTTRLLEAPHETEIIREVKEVREVDNISHKSLSEAPRSVREWDALSVQGPGTARSRSRHRSRRGSSPERARETIIEKKIVREEVSPARTHRTSNRDVSPARTHRSGRHTVRSASSRSGSDDETIIEKTKIIREEDEFDESNSVHVGPLALVVDRHPSRSDRDIKEEIRRLERERRELRRDRRYEREGEVIKVERVRERSLSPRGEVIVERRGDEILEVKKDKRVRARSRSQAPSAGVIKAMMATLT